MEATILTITVSFFIFIFSTITIISGWNQIYINGQKLASRNEANNLRQVICSSVEDIEKDATQFWMEKNEGKEHHALSTITFTAKLESIKKDLEVLKKYNIDLDISFEIRKLRSYITLDMERANSVKTDTKKDKLSNIINFSDRIKRKINYSFHKVYLPIEP